MTKLADLEGIGASYAAQLAEAGVLTTDEYIAQTGKPAGRQRLAEATGISSKLILKWANMIDLYRIKGIGSEYADLLERAGVDTVMELAQRNAANLHAQMAAVNEEKKLVRQLASAQAVASWIEQAQALPRLIEY